MFILCVCVKGDDGAAGVLSYLTGHLVKDAAEHAIAHGDSYVAYLICQVFGSEDQRHSMLKQLAAWSTTQVSYFILVFSGCDAAVCFDSLCC